MHLIAYMTLLFSLLCSLGLGLAAVSQRWSGRDNWMHILELGNVAQTALLSVGSIILFIALASNDFSFKYVADYTDVFLPMFYRLTAFWAGQAGSLLFWAWMVAIFGVCFQFTPGYKSLSSETRLHYWMFFYSIMAFFLLLMTCWSNPFVQVSPPPADGNGLNPLLQHPGMIFHPPLLFMGYAGFTIPACAALAQALSNGQAPGEGNWLPMTRNFTILSWLFLSAGIILGGWWSYMELGWGGYWAWDPVENASLIPWFAGSAFLHTAVLQERRGLLKQTNVFLIALTLMTSFFATYLVRSGVVDSLHAFSDKGVGRPLLIFIIALTVVSAYVAYFAFKPKSDRNLGSIFSREGFLVVTMWILLTLGLVILMGTMWPVFSQFWTEKPMGLEPGFYNRVCLPFFVILGLMLMLCPWLGWKDGFRKNWAALVLGGVFIASGAVIGLLGYTIPMALVGASAAVTCLAGFIMLFATDKGTRKRLSAWGAYGAHFGLALMILGVAFSGPYKFEKEVQMTPGDTVDVNGYELKYVDMREERTKAMAWVETHIEVRRDGELLGAMHPQRRMYRKFQNPYAEASVLALGGGFGDELYATLFGSAADKTAQFKFSIHPLVNWIWIGGTLLCIAPFLALRRFSLKK